MEIESGIPKIKDLSNKRLILKAQNLLKYAFIALK